MPMHRARRSTRLTRYGARAVVVAVVAGLLPMLPGPGTAPALAADVVSPACVSDYRAAMTKVSMPRAGVTTGGDHMSNFSAISGDGKTVVFTSKATNLVTGDTNAKDDIFVRDLSAATPVTERVSVSTTGVQSDGHSGVPPSVSQDGKLIVFDSYGSKLSVDNDLAKTFNTPSLANEQVTVPNNLDFGATATWEAWVYPTSYAGYNMIMTKGDLNGAARNQFELRLKITSGVLQFLQTGTAVQTVEATSAPALNAWNHVAVTKSGTTVRLYLNGVQNGSATSTIGTVPTNTDLFRIGARDDGVHEFAGRLDEVALYKRAVTAAEVAEHYRAGEGYSSVVKSHGAYSYWRLGETSGSVANDSGTANRDGTYVGAAGIGYSTAGALSVGDPLTDIDTMSRDVFLRDRTTSPATTTRVSKAHNGGNPNGGSFMPYITPNGRYVVFVSHATNIVTGDTNGQWDVFRRDMTTGITKRVSLTGDVTPVQANGLSTWPSVSDDGNLVSFLSEATNLVPNDTNGKRDAFVKNMTTGAVERVSLKADDAQAAGLTYEPWISGDGTKVVFTYDYNDMLGGAATLGNRAVFLRDRTEGITARVSVNDDETQPVGDFWSGRISGNGRFVTFHNASGGRHAYVRDLDETTTYLVSVTPAGTPAPHGSLTSLQEAAAMSWDGRKIAFSSGADLTIDSSDPYWDDVYVYDQGPVAGGGVKRFVDAWTPRVKTWTEAELEGGYSTAITNEGFHGMSADQKNYLVDCLFASLMSGYSTTAVPTAWRGELRLRLYDLVFDKGSLRNLVNHREVVVTDAPPVLPKPTDVIPAFVTAVLNGPRPDSLPRIAAEPLPIEPGPLLAEPKFDDVPEIVPVPTAPTVPAGSAAIVNGLTNPLVSVTDAVEDELTAVTSAVGLPHAPVDVFGTVAALPLPPLEYKACYQTATTGPACSSVVPLATVVPLDVTGDGTLDVAVTLSPNADSLHPLGQSNKLEAERLLTSETAGTPLKAHVYVVFELANAKQRISVGYDGYRHGVALAEKTTGIVTLKDLGGFSRGDVGTRFSLTHETPPSAWALTVGSRRYGEGDDADKEFDPVNAVVRFAPVPVTVSGNFDLRAPSGTDATRNMTVNADLSEPANVEFSVDQVTSSTGRTVAIRAKAASVPTSVHVSLDQNGTNGKTRVELANGAVVPRVSFLSRVSEGAQVEVAQGEALDVPATVTLDLVKEGKARIEAEYDASAVLRQLSFARYTDLSGVRDSTVVVRARALPTEVSAHYGSGDGGAREFNQFHYVADGDIEGIDIAVSDRSDGDATVVHGAHLPRQVDLDQDSAAKKVSVVANSAAGSLDVLFSKANGKAYRPAAAEHVTFVGSAEGDGPKAASLRLSGLREVRADYNDPLKVSGIVTAKASQFLVAARTPEATGFVELSNLPATFSVSVNRAGLTAHYEASGSVQRVAMNGSMPTGPLVDVVLDDLPGVVDVTATLGANPGFTYTADAVITAAKVLYSTDANPSPTAGTSVFGTLTGVPTSVVASVNTTTSTVDVQAPGGVGEIDLRVVSNGGPLHVPAGDHTTFFKRGDRAAASVRVGGLKTATAKFGEKLDAKLTVTPRGGFLVRGRVEDLYVDASVSDLPRSLDLVVTHDPIVATYTAMDPVEELRFYVTDYAGGTTFRGLARGLPSTMPATVNLPGNAEGVLPGVAYDASGTIDLVEIAYSPDHVTARNPGGSGRYLAASVLQVPRDFTVTYDTASGVIDWLSTTGQAGSVGAATRGVLPGNLTVLASASSVPAHWKATYTKEKIAFDGFGSTIGTVAAGITNDGTLPTSPAGYHFRARADVAGEFDISARIPNVTSAEYRTGDDTFHVGGGTGFGTSPLVVDVDVTQKGKDDSTTDDKRVKLVGRVTTVPSSFTVTVADDVVTYDSNGQFAAQLDGELGWISALNRAPALPLVYGAAVSDGACTSDDANCRPGPDVSLCKGTECFGLKFRILFEGSARKAVIDLGDTGPTVKLTDVRFTDGAFSAVTKIDDLTDLPLDDFVQQGIPQGVNLDFGPFTMGGGDGVPFTLLGETNHSSALGRLDAHLSLPDLFLDGGNTRAGNVKGHLMVKDVPAVLDLDVAQGASVSAGIGASHNISEIRADVDADYAHRNESGQWVVDEPGQSAVLRLTDVWGDSTGIRTTFVADNYNPGTAPPPKEPSDPHNPSDAKTTVTRCDPDGPQGGQSAPTEEQVAAKTERGMKTPRVRFSAPAPGTDVVVDVDAPLARMTTPLVSAAVQSAHFGLENLGTYAAITLSEKAKDLVVESLGGNIGRVWFETAFVLDVPCTKLHHESDIEIKDKETVMDQELDLQWVVNAQVQRFHISISEVANFRLVAGAGYLAYGVEGVYGTFKMAADDVAVDMDVEALYEVGHEPHWSWLGDIFTATLDLDESVTTLYAHLQDQTQERVGYQLQGQVGKDQFACIDLVETKPHTYAIQANGAEFTNGTGQHKQNVFTWLDPQVDPLVAATIDIATANALSPFPKKMSLEWFNKVKCDTVQ